MPKLPFKHVFQVSNTEFTTSDGLIPTSVGSGPVKPENPNFVFQTR